MILFFSKLKLENFLWNFIFQLNIFLKMRWEPCLKLLYPNLIKGYRGGSKTFFYKLILFNSFLFYLPDDFYSLTKLKVVFEIQGFKALIQRFKEFNRFVMEGANQKHKKFNFTKNLYLPTFFKLFTTNFQKCSFHHVEKSYYKN